MSLCIRFLASNVLIAVIIVILSAVRQLLGKVLTSRMRYHLWFLMMALLAVPFLPLRSRPMGILGLFSWMGQLRVSPFGNVIGTRQAIADTGYFTAGEWMNDAVSFAGQTIPDIIEYLLVGVWAAGVLVMVLLSVRSGIRFYRLKQSALPVQNREVRQLYRQCLEERNIKRVIPIYSTAFLTSPVMAGCLRPGIYLPIHLISDYDAAKMRYMLLHELEHYRHGDAWVGWLMNLAGILYWFHPFVWYGLREMRHDREVACDTSVLERLEKKEFFEYGNTLIQFAEKVSLTPFPYTAGIGGSMKQMKRRILNIASYRTPSPSKKRRGLAAFGITALLLSCFVPSLSVYGGGDAYASWPAAGGSISQDDFSAYFGDYDGSFVLFDGADNGWTVYNREDALLRSAPYSTFKIYSALIGLESGVISPFDSSLDWNGEHYPIESWNGDQTLTSAMNNSVNWYFQKLDEKAGINAVSNFVKTAGYGNQKLTGTSPSFWLNPDLKISPVEQVELLIKLNENDFNAAPEHIQAVKEAIRLQTTTQGTLYGKTGTGVVNGQSTGGWFVGYVERDDGDYYFAVHLVQKNPTAAQEASGSAAAEIACSILADLQLWN